MSGARADGFDRVVRYIGEEMAFESGYYNDAYLDRRVTARMRRTDADDYEDYLSLLRHEADEREALLDALSINVTSFFRNPDMWEEVRGVLQDLSAQRRRPKLWSAPCADGREPYSMAMLALDDDEVDTTGLSITATDIDAGILETAREGRYETSQTTDIGEELSLLDDYEAYIDQDGSEFQVRDRVKRLVDFERHDLIRGDPKRGFDLVFCRNLLIYIDTEYKQPILETVRDSLREGGYLVIGMTETIPRELKPSFEAVDSRHRIYRRQ